jgi:hypothetical protein
MTVCITCKIPHRQRNAAGKQRQPCIPSPTGPIARRGCRPGACEGETGCQYDRRASDRPRRRSRGHPQRTPDMDGAAGTAAGQPSGAAASGEGRPLRMARSGPQGLAAFVDVRSWRRGPRRRRGRSGCPARPGSGPLIAGRVHGPGSAATRGWPGRFRRPARRRRSSTSRSSAAGRAGDRPTGSRSAPGMRIAFTISRIS